MFGLAGVVQPGLRAGNSHSLGCETAEELLCWAGWEGGSVSQPHLTQDPAPVTQAQLLHSHTCTQGTAPAQPHLTQDPTSVTQGTAPA